MNKLKKKIGMIKNYACILGVALLLMSCINSSRDQMTIAIEEILSRISEPEFPDQVYNIVDFGAIPDGQTNSKPAVDAAIAKCHQNGGGRVLIPEGDFFLAGPIHLKSNINLHLDENAHVLFSQNASDYLPVVLVRWEGVECYNYSPFIYAKDQENIAITGEGRFDGNGANGMVQWRPKQKPSQNLMRQMGREGVPLEERIFGEGHFIRPSFIQLMNCQNILIQDVTIENVPFWVIHPTYCKNVTVRGVTVNSLNLNNDGVDPDSSEDVLIEDCHFNCGDDAIAIKSGRDQDGWKIGKPSRNIVIRNNTAGYVLHGMALGSEMSAGIENVYIQNFHIQKVKEYGLQFKANQDRGGYIKDVYIDNMSFDSVYTAIFFTNDYHSYAGGTSPSEFFDISIKNLTCNYASGRGIEMVGTEAKPIRNIHLENIHIYKTEEKPFAKHMKSVELKEVFANSQKINSISDN